MLFLKSLEISATITPIINSFKNDLLFYNFLPDYSTRKIPIYLNNSTIL